MFTLTKVRVISSESNQRDYKSLVAVLLKQGSRGA